MKFHKILLFFAILGCSVSAFAAEFIEWSALNAEQRELIELAIRARSRAYAPYSNFQVGAALKTFEGQIFTGANVENASYGLTVCAERIAVLKAVSEGSSAIKLLAIVTKNGGMPCGACRQVMNEFNPNTQVLVSDMHKKTIMLVSLKDLLPKSFGPKNVR